MIFLLKNILLFLLRMNLEVRLTKNKGRGVFSQREFLPWQIIEKCPVILLRSKDESDLIRKTALDEYTFCRGYEKKDDRNTWKGESLAIPLWYGCLYNHSYTPNAMFKICEKEKEIVFKCIKKITLWEEITHNYNWDPKNKLQLWFKVE